MRKYLILALLAIPTLLSAQQSPGPGQPQHVICDSGCGGGGGGGAVDQGAAGVDPWLVSADVTLPGDVDETASSIIPLAAHTNFISPWIPATDYALITAMLSTDQDGILTVRWSGDCSGWHYGDQISTVGGNFYAMRSPVVGTCFQIVLSNVSDDDQTELMLKIIKHRTDPGLPTPAQVGTQETTSSPAALTKSVIAGVEGDTVKLVEARSSDPDGTDVGVVTRNIPSGTQDVSGTFWQAVQPVSGTFFQATQPVSGTFFQATQPVSGTFWQATQPVSAAALPLPSGASTSALQTTGNTTLSTIDGKIVVANTSNTTMPGDADGGASSTTPLVSGDSYTGLWRSATNYSHITALVNTDQDGELSIEWSGDCSDTQYTDSMDVLAGVGAVLRSPKVGECFRVVFENTSAFDQMTFVLTGIKHRVDPGVTSTSAASVGSPATEATLASIDSKITVVDTTGLATESTLQLLNGKVAIVDTTDVTITNSVLPTGASTAARQDTGNTSVASIDTKAVQERTADYDSGGGTVTTKYVGIALPGSGGPVAGGTSAAPVRTDPTGTTPQPVSGTVTANISGSISNTSFTATQATGTNLHTVVDSGSITAVQGTGTNLHTVVDSGAITATGAAASGAAKSGNPVQQGGVFNTVQPTVTNGQAVEAQSTARGAQIVGTGADTFNVTVNAALPAGAAVIGHVIADTGSTTAVTQATGTNLHAVLDSGTLTTVSTVTAVTAISNALPAGANLIGKVGIDQTTPGTTNRVDVGTFPDNEPINVAQMNGVATSMGVGASGTGTQRTAALIHDGTDTAQVTSTSGGSLQVECSAGCGSAATSNIATISFAESSAAPTAATWYIRRQWALPASAHAIPQRAWAGVTTAASRTMVAVINNLGNINLSTNTFTAANSVASPFFYGRLFGCVTTIMSAASDNLTVTYTDELGNSQAAAAVTFAASSPVGNCFEIPLNAAAVGLDVGVRAVTAVTDSAAPTGVVTIYGVNPLLDTLGPAATLDSTMLDNGELAANEQLVIMLMQAATTAQQRSAGVTLSLR